MKDRSSFRFALLLGAVTMHQGLVWGQTAETSPRGDALEEIVVTAQKREQPIDSVGMTITAATAFQLRELGVNGVADLTKIEPSFVVSLNEEGEPFYQIRGIGFNSDSLAAPPAVTVYVDEIPYSYAPLTKGAALDLERVEILKGPQGILFGQNATGGAVNYIAAKPTDTLEYGTDVSYGRFNAVNIDGFLSGPITDTLKARLAFSVEEGGAWQYSVTRGDTLGNRDNQYARVLLDWTPSEKLKVSVNLNGWKDNSDRQAPADSALALLNPPYAAFVPLTVNEPIAPHDPRAADWPSGISPKNDESFYQGSLRVDYNVSDALTLTYLGTYEHFDADDVQSYEGTQSVYYAVQLATIDSNFHELRASGKILDDKLDWLIGANYSEDRDNENLLDHVAGATTAYVLTGLPGVTGPINIIDPAMTQNTITKSVFGNLEYHLLDNLSVHGGVRYTESDIEHTGCMRAEDPVTAQTFTVFEALLRGGVGVVPVSVGGCATIDPATILPTLTVDSLDQHNVPWRVGIDWNPIEKTLLYATASRGYKAGSFPNIGAVSTKALSPATQESVTAYEVGVKSRLDGGKLQIDGAVFHYNYDNKQEELRVPDPIFGLLNTLLNVPKSELRGAELSITYRPVIELTLNGAATYLDSEVVGNFFNYSQFATGPMDTINFKGEQLPNTPRWAFDIGARYDWAVSGNYGAYLGGDVRYSAETQSFFGAYSATAAGFPSMVNASYSVLNLCAGVQTNDGQWRFEAFGDNVTNAYYTLQSIRLDTVARYTGMPATFGIRVSYRYK